MGRAQIKLGDPVCSDNRHPDGAAWFILGRAGFCDSPDMEGSLLNAPDAEGSSVWRKFLLSDTIGVGVLFQLLNEYAKL